MSMITEQVEYLIKLSNKHPFDSNILTLQRACKEAANTISVLSEKLHTANMERSTAYYHGGWIPTKDKLPEDHDWYLVVVREKSTGYQYIPRVASHLHGNDWCLIDTEDANKEWLADLECIAWTFLPEPYREDGAE